MILLLVHLAKMPCEASLNTARETFGVDPITFGKIVLEASLAGLVQSWQNLEGRDVLVLTTLAAEQLNIEPSNSTALARKKGERISSTWVSRDRKQRSSRNAGVTPKRAFKKVDHIAIDHNATDPCKASTEHDDVKKTKDAAAANPDHPVSRHELRLLRTHPPTRFIFMGTGNIWTDVKSKSAVCQVCQNNPPALMSYCLFCDRCGIDDLLDVASSKPKAKRLA